jgi:hypothetical protein
MTQAADLRIIRDQIIANVKAESATPKPSYSIDGESVDWTTWAKAQQDRIEQLNRMINAVDPFILTTRQSL